MPKRKQDANGGSVANEANDSSGEEDFDTLDVEFEWFDPDTEIDYKGIDALLKQLFDVDAPLLNMSAITELILAQPLLGSTVKVDGKETDAYAFLSVINLQEHRDKTCIQELVQYLLGRTRTNPALAQVAQLLADPASPPVGLILSERLINVPAEVVPPMYSMLIEEMQWAVDEKEPYTFSHYLVLSKTYTEVASKLDEEDDRPKKKKKASGLDGEVFHFHAEDEILQRHALCSGGFDYMTRQDDGSSDSKRAFQELGIRPRSHAFLIENSRFEGAVKAMAEFLQPS